MKAHKNRVKPLNKSLSRKIKNSSKWELDVTHRETIKRLKRLHDANDNIDWAIFDFKDYKKNTKYLVIPDNAFGTGGSEELSKNLAQIDEMRYAVLAIVYGHIVKRRLVLLIIWNPLIHNAMMKNNNNNNNNNNNLGIKSVSNSKPKRTKHRHHSAHSTTILFWQHKEKIKTFANAKKEMNINLHSKLAESMIISSLHRDGLLDDIIIRVTKNTTNKSLKDIVIPINEDYDTDTENDKEQKERESQQQQQQQQQQHFRHKSIHNSPVRPTPVPRQWTLKQLKQKLCDDYNMKINKIRISLVPNIVKVQRRKKSFSSARQQSHHHIMLEGDDKKLFELGIDHGSQIYITDEDDSSFQNSKIKQDRLRAWDKILQNER